MSKIGWQHVYVVLRYDKPDFLIENHQAGNSVTAKSVHRSSDIAQAEVARLNALNSAKSSYYFWQSAKSWPEEEADC